MKTTSLILAVALLGAPATALAQNNGNGNGNGNGADTSVDTSTEAAAEAASAGDTITTSGDTVTTGGDSVTTGEGAVFEDSFDDNRDYIFEDSFDNNSDNFSGEVNSLSADVFGDNAIVAESTLSNVVTGVVIEFGDVTDTARSTNSLRNNGNAFQNYSGINALNQNTGAAASQNASVNIAVSTDSFDVD